jgi:hypothetical protein
MRQSTFWFTVGVCPYGKTQTCRKLSHLGTLHFATTPFANIPLSLSTLVHIDQCPRRHFNGRHDIQQNDSHQNDIQSNEIKLNNK